MNVFKLSIVAVAVAGLSGCFSDGDDGQQGPAGQNGANGQDGASSLTVQTPLALGDANCPNTGVRLDSGLDANGNGQLDAGEVSATSYVCSPGVDRVASTELLTSLNNEWFIDAQNAVEENRQQWLSLTRGQAASGSAEMSAQTFAFETAADMQNAIETLRGQAKNVILFIGDGMGISTVTASRIMEGQTMGLNGEEHALSFDNFPFAGLSKTYNVDAQTPDSAGTMTAMMSGVKTDVGTIGLDEDVSRGDCSTVAGNQLVTALELAELAGKSTGVVSTARITHATPAATYAKSPDRNWEDVSDMSAEAVAQGCKDIADQLINFEANLEARFPGTDVNGIEVVMGGGRRHFLPRDAAFNSPDASSSVEGDRTDGRDLTAEWQSQYATGAYVFDQAGFDAIDTETTSHVFGLFNESHMRYEADRSKDVAGEPSLSEMTEKAIRVLNNNQNGFFLMVESGRIDHSHHAGSAHGALNDTIEFAQAVARADELTSDEDTLIIVTADHGHVFTIAGYAKRGNPILGKVMSVGSDEPANAADGQPYTVLGYTNGLGYRDLGDDVTDADASYAAAPDTGRKDITGVNTESAGYHQEALIPMSSETHSGEDVGIYAKGPGAFLVNGTNEQSIIFHVMDFGANLVEAAQQAVE